MLTRRVLWLVALALAPALAIQGYNEVALRSARYSSTRDDALRAARATADDLGTVADSFRQVLRLLSLEDVVRDKDPAGCSAYLRSVVADLPGVAIVLMTNVDGSLVCNSRGSAPGAFTTADRRYHQRALATGAFAAGDYVEGLASGQRSIHFAQPVRDAAGATVGVVALAVDLAWLSRRLAQPGLPPGGALSVIDADGRVLLRAPNHEFWTGRQLDPGRLATIQANVGLAWETTNLDGRPTVAGTARPPGVLDGLTVSVARERDTLFADIDAATARGALLILVGAAFALAAALAGAHAFIRRPVSRLLAAAAAWRRGDLTARTRLTGLSEFGQLGDAFDGMAAALQRHESELRDEIVRGLGLQAKQTTMLHELNHRVKNTLATVQSLVRQSRGGETRAMDLEARIIALSKTHDLLTRDEWTGAPLREILENELGPYRAGVDHIMLEGPDVNLPARHVLALGMTLHELTTNAAKYGALSVPGGRVDVAWHLSREEPGRRRLHVTWQESGGPTVSEPTRRGFGTRLIAGGMRRELDGEVELSFEESGLRCRIDVPIEAPTPWPAQGELVPSLQTRTDRPAGDPDAEMVAGRERR